MSISRRGQPLTDDFVPHTAPRSEKSPYWAICTAVAERHRYFASALVPREAESVCQSPPLAHLVGVVVVDGTGRGAAAPLNAAQR